ncbi:hypothetical protein MCEGE10_02882 [Flavobacteriaceae bacterium]
MKNNKFGDIKSRVQEIIDFVALNNYETAKIKIKEVSDSLDEILDVSPYEDDVMEISRYKILLNQLLRKMSFEE